MCRVIVQGPYLVVLPICKACIESGCHVIVRSARVNAKAMHARLEQENAREAAKAREAEAVASSLAASEATTTTSNIDNTISCTVNGYIPEDRARQARN